MTGTADKLGVAVVGLGVGQAHARAYLATERCGLRYVYDLDRAKARRVAEELGSGVASSFEQILSDPRVRAISVASYDDAHFEEVAAALEAGKHVFVEKPLCRTLEELGAIKRAWGRHGGAVKLSSNLVLRAAPLYGWLKERLEAGEFGEVYAFDGDYLYGRLDKLTEGWRRDVEDYSAMEGGGVHLVDLLLWLTGRRPETVTAAGNRICTRGTPFRYHDYVAATLRCAGGLVARITANMGCVHRHQHAVRVFGTRASFLYDDAGGRLHTTRDPQVPAWPVECATLPASKGELVAPFVKAILNDEDLQAHTQTLFDGIAVCVACEEALQGGAAVEVNYV